MEAVGLSYLRKGRPFLHQTQSLIIAGCFSGQDDSNAWVTHPSHVSAIAEPLPEYHSNVVEADTSIWRHATQTWATKILTYSPDTNVYNIGLGLVNHTSKQLVVEINVLHATEKRYLHLNNLYLALQKDPDLASLPRNDLGVIVQSLFICTGCDFVSYFKTIGNTIFSMFSFNMLTLYADLGHQGVYMIQLTQVMASCHLFAWLEHAISRNT